MRILAFVAGIACLFIVLLDAFQTDELCPCNWQKGQDTLKAA